MHLDHSDMLKSHEIMCSVTDMSDSHELHGIMFRISQVETWDAAVETAIDDYWRWNVSPETDWYLLAWRPQHVETCPAVMLTCFILHCELWSFVYFNFVTLQLKLELSFSLASGLKTWVYKLAICCHACEKHSNLMAAKNIKTDLTVWFHKRSQNVGYAQWTFTSIKLKDDTNRYEISCLDTFEWSPTKMDKNHRFDGCKLHGVKWTNIHPNFEFLPKSLYGQCDDEMATDDDLQLLLSVSQLRSRNFIFRIFSQFLNGQCPLL
jgi:hypothetical protein